MSDVSPPTTAATNKRPASPSPSADSTAQASAKRAKPDGESKSDTEKKGESNGNGEAGEPTKKKMDEVEMEGADAGPSNTLAPAPSSVPAAPVKSEAPPQQISMRSLIVTQDASIIIGRGGAHVNEIREKSSARVTVSESIPGNPERILNVSGALDAVAKAFGLIVRRINDEPFDVASVPGSRAVTIKFIIPNSRMGSVIGKGGSKIKEIQEASGARLNASEAMLPGSTERVLSVSGVADAVHIAVYYIGTILLEYQERNPGASTSSYRQVGARNGPPGGGGGAPPQFNNKDPNAPPPPGMQTQQIFIPNSLVGAIIGKGGSKINEIRGQSQCQIRVTDPGTAAPGTVANPEERLVTITGYPHNINTAVSLLYAVSGGCYVSFVPNLQSMKPTIA
ncbi:poly(rC)-binding protein 2/3/4 [Kwoniella mangroviensis CBS 10435]|uniref:Poly(RC)-binding protein 2/3/4 n=1 Tax=Kwoniella mangroviensis CBS 10435 TaxID=1331196 RepID=A0A1B9ITL9_9TREE|nr:poly(rC)-binding protein 2/3/4 [Kwoniella mangroviensis CBS 8507]OCF58876.1 poly(rC)-binding protein 2/3/4 [Kwoniella mangroviensis CBS 10435]OCF68668.1 poly(rC)-binding protein 2/3/4 [Kwoniella mangroviensis CBS 8507]